MKGTFGYCYSLGGDMVGRCKRSASASSEAAAECAREG